MYHKVKASESILFCQQPVSDKQLNQQRRKEIMFETNVNVFVRNLWKVLTLYWNSSISIVNKK